jgi:Zn-dependent membrane protease YugP
MALYFLLIGVPLILGLYAQYRVKHAFTKYAQVPVSTGVTGARAAQEILDAAQIHDVEIVELNGSMLGDHYDPTNKRLVLSSDVYRGASVAAVGVAAHETGHAIQHARAYAPLKARMAIVPVTQLASQALPFIMMGGLVFGILALFKLGIVCYLVLTVFQLITLPVEFDASRRAKIILEQMGIVQSGPESIGVSRVLNAAALTYVAAFVAALANLFYLILVSRNRN